MSPTDAHDVRMRGFGKKHSLDAAIAWLDQHPLPRIDQPAPLDQLAGRILAKSIASPINVPGFPRAMMDGFAGIAATTKYASPDQPVHWRITGSNLPGRPTTLSVTADSAVRVMTGAPMPERADVVVPFEECDYDAEFARVARVYRTGKNVGPIGEDITAGQVVLHAGRRLRPQDVGLIASLGMSTADVRAPLRVAILITGNELLPAGTPPTGVHITDSNGPMLTALVRRDGGVITSRQMLEDDPAVIAKAMRAEAEVVIVSGGSSVGMEDHAAAVLARDGQLAIHGIALRPGSPAGLGTLEHRLVALLPGNPVACLSTYDLLIGRAIRDAAGFGKHIPYRSARFKLTRDIRAAQDRVDYVRVQLEGDGVAPIFMSGASRLSSTTQAIGFVLVPPQLKGISSGETVEVWLYD